MKLLSFKISNNQIIGKFLESKLWMIYAAGLSGKNQKCNTSLTQTIYFHISSKKLCICHGILKIKCFFNILLSSQDEKNSKKKLIFVCQKKIQKKSTKFIASPLSSWSQTVLVDRMAAGITDDESILSICLPDVTDVPELTWLFPEGEQIFYNFQRSFKT